MSALNLELNPIFGMPLSIILIIILFLALGFYMWQSGKAKILRALSFLALSLIILNPSKISNKSKPLPDIIGILIDKSSSMKAAKRENGALEAANKLKAQLEKNPNNKVIVSDISQAPDGTRIGAAKDMIFANYPNEQIGGLAIITDGQIKDYKDIKASYPINQLLVGEKDEKDIYLKLIQSPIATEVGKNAKIIVRAITKNINAQNIVLNVHIGNNEAIQINAKPNQDTAINIPIKERGSIPVAIEAQSVDGEISIVNNSIITNIEGVRDRLKVLLVSGSPYEGLRAWRNLLKSDPSVDLVHFTILRSHSKQDETPETELSLIPFPTEELFLDKLQGFDLIVFDRFEQIDALPDSYLNNVSEWVKNGGAFLILCGPAEAQNQGALNSALAKILPIEGKATEKIEEFSPTLTEQGKNHPITQGLDNQKLAPWTSHLIAKTNGINLLEANGAPLLTISEVGKGRVAAVLSDKSWLWQRGYKGGGPFRELFRRTAHWLMKEPELEAQKITLKPNDNSLEIAIKSQLHENEIILGGPNGLMKIKPQYDNNSYYETTINNLPQGLYSVYLGNSAAFAIVGSSVETIGQDLTANDEAFKQIKNNDGASYFIGKNGVNLPNNMNFRKNNYKEISAISKEAAINPILLGAIFAALTLFAWFREGKRQ